MSTRSMTYEKDLLIISSSSILKTLNSDGNFMYKWRIELQSDTENGVETDKEMAFVDKVEFYLHETFDIPRIVVTEPPFLIDQKGWGSFFPMITLYFKDRNQPPKTIKHDLNFVKPRYVVNHTLKFKNISPRFMALLFKKGEDDRPKVSSKIPFKRTVARKSVLQTQSNIESSSLDSLSEDSLEKPTLSTNPTLIPAPDSSPNFVSDPQTSSAAAPSDRFRERLVGDEPLRNRADVSNNVRTHRLSINPTPSTWVNFESSSNRGNFNLSANNIDSRFDAPNVHQENNPMLQIHSTSMSQTTSYQPNNIDPSLEIRRRLAYFVSKLEPNERVSLINFLYDSGVESSAIVHAPDSFTIDYFKIEPEILQSTWRLVVGYLKQYDAVNQS